MSSFKRFDHFARSLVSAGDGMALDYRSLSPQQPGHAAFAFDDFTCCCAGGGKFAFADLRGGLTITHSMSLRPRRYEVASAAAGEDGDGGAIVFMGMSSSSSLLVCCTARSMIKVFRLTDDGTATSNNNNNTADAGAAAGPKLVASYQLKKRQPTTGAPPPPSCFAQCVVNAHLHVAVGYPDGQTAWLKVLLPPSDSSPSPSSPPLVRWFDLAQPVTAVGFVLQAQHLLVAGKTKVSCVEESSASSSSSLRETVLDGELGCELECGVSQADSCFVTCSDDRVQFFTPDSPGSCYSIPGRKLMLRALADNTLVLVTTTSTTTITGEHTNNSKVLQVLDLANKFIAHEFALIRGDAVCLLCASPEDGCVFALTKMKKLWRLRENALEARLNDLLKRNLYSIAIRLAKTNSSKCDLNYVADLHRRYAEHLYDKRNFEDAVQQFCLTIGRIEPSYVIRRFLDSNQVANLATYLEALHSAAGGGASSFSPSADHTTLLLTCYAKLKQEDKIMAFIKASSSSSSSSLDVPAALNMLKETGQVQAALELARDHGQHEWYVATLLATAATAPAVSDALAYIRRARPDRLDLFLQHSFVFAKHLPDACLEFAQHYCYAVSSSTTTTSASEELFLDAFMCDARLTARYCALLCNRQFDLAEHDNGDNDSSSSSTDLSPRVWNACLEVALQQGGDLQLSHRICAHLCSSSSSPSSLESRLDVPHALYLLRQHGDTASLYLVLERLGRYRDLLQCKLEAPPSTLAADNNEDVFRLAVDRFPDDADVWLAVLAFFAHQQQPRAEEPSSRDAHLRECLQHIEAREVLPALTVLDLLSDNPVEVNLGVMCAYLVSQMQRATHQSDLDRQEVQRLREDTDRMQRERRALETQPRLFNATTCSLTGAPLELPVVHFLSGNTYNLTSLASSSSSSSSSSGSSRLQDPKCAHEQSSVFDIAKGLAKRRADMDEEFFSELQLVRDSGGGEAGFNFVAEYFGKCLFDDDDDGGGEYDDDDDDNAKEHNDAVGRDWTQVDHNNA